MATDNQYDLAPDPSTTATAVADWCARLPDRKAQDDLIEAFVWLANNLAVTVGSGRYRLDENDARSITYKYLIAAVMGNCKRGKRRIEPMPNGCLDPAAYIEKKIKNALRTAAKREKRHRQSLVFDSRKLDCDRPNDSQAAELIEQLTGAKLRPRVDAPCNGFVPIDAAEREKYEQEQADEIRKINNKLRLRDEKEIKPGSKHAMPADVRRSGNDGLYQLILELAKDQSERTMLRMLAEGKGWAAISAETGLAQSTLKSKRQRIDQQATALGILP